MSCRFSPISPSRCCGRSGASSRRWGCSTSPSWSSSSCCSSSKASSAPCRPLGSRGAAGGFTLRAGISIPWFAMDVTPRELRDTDIREGFRGYHRDDVDELLERAASTVEGLTERVRQLTERLSSVEGSAGKSRETEEMLQRTLVLAQKTADEAIAEAQQRARTMLEESETKARTLVSDAEGTARRIAENERQRLESEILDLSSRREALNADVEALEKYESEYRSRLRKAIESELDSLGKFSGQQTTERPKLHEVEMPVPREAIANSGRPPGVPTAEIGRASCRERV